MMTYASCYEQSHTILRTKNISFWELNGNLKMGIAALVIGQEVLHLGYSVSRDNPIISIAMSLLTLSSPIIIIAAARAIGRARFGEGADLIIAMDNVRCTSTEARLSDCSYRNSTLITSSCSHREDAGVICEPRKSSHTQEIKYLWVKEYIL